MGQIKTLLPTFFLALVALLGTACRPESGPGVVRIATAANMQYAMDDICNRFTKDTGYTCQVLVGSSGKLTAQIQQGAPFDVMVSADLIYPQYLYEQRLTKVPPRVYARGKLALWSMQPEVKLSMAVLNQPEIRRIALANPETAPYGKAALEALEKHGLLQEVRHKLIFGESIAQVNQFVESGAAEVGFTAGSVKNAPPVQGKGQWLSLEDSSYMPILQAAVLLSGEGTTSEQAMDFYEYLFSERARSVLKKYGYAVDE